MREEAVPQERETVYNGRNTRGASTSPMTHLRKLMLDILADISLLLSFTPNARMQRIGS